MLQHAGAPSIWFQVSVACHTSCLVATIVERAVLSLHSGKFCAMQERR